MTIPATMRSPPLIYMARLFVLLSLLICSQETQVVALPTGVANSLFPTSSTWKNHFTTQFPPTTTVNDKVPGTKGVSSCYSHLLANIEFTFPHTKKQRTENGADHCHKPRNGQPVYTAISNLYATAYRTDSDILAKPVADHELFLVIGSVAYEVHE